MRYRVRVLLYAGFSAYSVILVSLHWWQRSDMATAIHGLALPEISVENFEHSWTRFEFTAAANKWDNGRDLVILPALLRGKLQDFYTTLNDDEKKDLATLKRALSDRGGLTKDPLASQHKKDANHILIPQVICYFISVPKLLSFWYRYEKTDHLWNQNMICVFFLLCVSEEVYGKEAGCERVCKVL